MGTGIVYEAVYKRPVSVLVVIYTAAGEVLLIERADHPGFWQSVTGSQDEGEGLIETAAREVREETGIAAAEHVLTDWQHSIEYEIYPRWRHRYAPGVTRNTEHWFGLQLNFPVVPVLSPREHVNALWLPWQQAAEKVFSPSNAEAIRLLAAKIG